eukprot:495573_1
MHQPNLSRCTIWILLAFILISSCSFFVFTVHHFKPETSINTPAKRSLKTINLNNQIRDATTQNAPKHRPLHGDTKSVPAPPLNPPHKLLLPDAKKQLQPIVSLHNPPKLVSLSRPLVPPT